ncbi:MAG: diguanylate cyclase [Alphaproteobacteria bacterium]|nr:diguanylate cyclase [Alphaproteobacteria bacterium]
MHYSHSIEKASKFAADALERMHQEVLPPTPENFEVWYVYYSGENPEITRAIDILVASHQQITAERCQELHQRFLSDTSENERVRKAGDKIQSTIKDVNSAVSNVKDATHKYNDSLEQVAAKLGSKVSKEEIEIILATVKAGTQDMMRQNQQLEEELSKSSRVMKELQRDLEQVRKEALTDSLTNLTNRKAFDAEARRLATECDANKQTFSLIMMDIDYFKSFNDNYGHQVGDQVLRLVARTLIEGVKGRDMAARFGGEEFVIILPETNVAAAVKVADYLRRAVAGKEVINRNTGGKLGRITLSGGVAEYVHGESMDDLITRADAALYTAKHNGRNQIAAAPAPGAKKVAS